MKVMDMYWISDPKWYDITDDDEVEPFLTNKAPPEAIESFKRHLEQMKSNGV